MSSDSRLTLDMSRIFEPLPDQYLILSPDLTILTASNSYLSASGTRREEIAGKFLFAAFLDNPEELHVSAHYPLHASLQKVLSIREPHIMELIRYDLPLPPEQGGGMENKYWKAVMTNCYPAFAIFNKHLSLQYKQTVC